MNYITVTPVLPDEMMKANLLDLSLVAKTGCSHVGIHTLRCLYLRAAKA